MTSKHVTTIFVDGNCIVCDWEISKYKRMAPELFELVDISDPAFDAGRYGLTPDAVNREMHVLTPSGELKVGVAAFAQIWRTIPALRPLAAIVEFPIMRPMARAGYWMFTVVRPYLPKRRAVAA